MDTSLVSIEERKQSQLLKSGLITADRFINKNYLINIAEQNVVPLNEEERSTNIRLLQILKLVYDKENINEKLISVYSAIQNVSSAILIISGSGKDITFYIGINSIQNASVAANILDSSFVGNFPGSSLRRLKNSEISEVMDSITSTRTLNTSLNVSCVTVIPSMRDEKEKEKFVQGIEKFIDTMQGKEYSAIFIAKPVSKEELQIRKRGYEELYSSLSPFIKTTLQYSDNDSKAVSEGLFENFSHSVNNSISNTTGRNSGVNTSFTRGRNHGTSMGAGGFSFNTGTSSSTTNGYSSAISFSQSITQGTSDTTGSGTNRSDTMTTGSSRSLSVEHQNKSVAVLLEKIDDQLKRIKSCEAFGVWLCACYFISKDIQTSVVAASTYRALMLGDKTDVENSFVNVWGIKNPENTERVLSYLRYGEHPLFEIAPEEGFEPQFVTPGYFISGRELPLLLGLPHQSVSGLNVSSIARFGRNVFVQNAREGKKIELGKIYHMGITEESTVELDLDSFTSHCFITGSTGSGKSNTSYGLLEKFIQNNIPFLVVEPAKGEYKDAFGGVEGINIFSTNPLIGQMLKLNPFRFEPKKIHILEHLDRLIEIFNACWEMYAAMPAILKDAVEKIYINKGWDLLNSVYMGDGEPVFPTFSDLMVTLPNIINTSGYSADTKGDYIGALVTRVTSLTNGISGQIFCDSYDIPDSVMFDDNTVVDLSRVGSTETKSLIMGIIVLKLSEYRMANATQANSGLRHITVLEEAHNLLKRTTPGSEGSNVVGKSVEMICNSIAEMRTYGEGFIIVDQSPTAVDISAIKNTNTKIVMRLPEKGDCEAVGNAVGLNDEQIREIAKLGTGIAVVMQNNWLEAVLTHINAFDSEKYGKKIPFAEYSSMKKLKGAVVKELMQQYIVDRTMNLDRMLKVIDDVDVISYKKEEMRCCMRYVIQRLQKGRDIDFFCETLMNVSGTKNLFDIIAETIQESSEGAEEKYEASSVKKWKTRFKAELQKYLDLPDNFNDTLVKYLIHAQEMEQTSIDYFAIRKILY